MSSGPCAADLRNIRAGIESYPRLYFNSEAEIFESAELRKRPTRASRPAAIYVKAAIDFEFPPNDPNPPTPTKPKVHLQSPAVKMSHESVWNSRPRTYGKGARAWYVVPLDPHNSAIIVRRVSLRLTDRSAAFAPTRPVSFASTASTFAVNASGRRQLISDSSRYTFTLVYGG